MVAWYGRWFLIVFLRPLVVGQPNLFVDALPTITKRWRWIFNNRVMILTLNPLVGISIAFTMVFWSQASNVKRDFSEKPIPRKQPRWQWGSNLWSIDCKLQAVYQLIKGKTSDKTTGCLYDHCLDSFSLLVSPIVIPSPWLRTRLSWPLHGTYCDGMWEIISISWQIPACVRQRWQISACVWQHS